MRTILMPGMDGTGRLFERLSRSLPKEMHHDVVRYPASEPLGYDSLLDAIPVPDGDVAIVAESFSGPLAIRLASRLGDRVQALVLVATFACSPSRLIGLATLFGALPFCVAPPRVALRAFLLDSTASDENVDELQRVILSVSPSVMARRLSEIAKVDVRADLAKVQCPTMYVRGARDRIVGASALAAIRAVMPSITVEALDAPHLVLQRRPDQSAQLIADFIQSSL